MKKINQTVNTKNGKEEFYPEQISAQILKKN